MRRMTLGVVAVLMVAALAGCGGRDETDVRYAPLRSLTTGTETQGCMCYTPVDPLANCPNDKCQSGEVEPIACPSRCRAGEIMLRWVCT